MIDRRSMIQATGLAGLGLTLPARGQTGFAARSTIVPINALPDRLMRITVCLRPFRAAAILRTQEKGKELKHKTARKRGNSS